jgi:pimeloyl-ACP methyl ester carboxylesterase
MRISGHFMVKLAAVTVIAFTCQVTKAEHICGEGKTKEGVEYRYCVDSTTDLTQAVRAKANVIYFLHGMGGSEKTWSTAAQYRPLRSQWQATATMHPPVHTTAPTPVVISISLGPLWLLTETSKFGTRSLQAVFVADIIPKIEARFGIREPYRIALGESAGGFNAVQLFAKESSKFAKIALVCPAIATIGPLSSDDEVNAYIERHQPYVQTEWVKNTMTLIRSEFPTEVDWLKHDPFMLVMRLNRQSPKLFVSCTTQDEHGFFEGAQRFAREAIAQGVQTRWLPIIGGSHCNQTTASLKALGEFLTSP